MTGPSGHGPINYLQLVPGMVGWFLLDAAGERLESALSLSEAVLKMEALGVSPLLLRRQRMDETLS